MLRKITLAALFLTVMSAGAAAQNNAAQVVAAASKAMGADNLNSITMSGSARNGQFGQSKSLANPLGPTNTTVIREYTRTINFVPTPEPMALVLRATGPAQPPTTIGQPAPMPNVFNQNVTTMQASNNWGQALNVWLSPWGCLKGAAGNAATVRTQGGSQLVTFTPSNFKAPSGALYSVTCTITNNLVTKTETRVEHPIAGDLLVEFEYSNYQNRNGVQVPGRMVQRQAGLETFNADITAATANPANLTELLTPPPAPARGGGPGGGAPAAAPAGGRGAAAQGDGGGRAGGAADGGRAGGAAAGGGQGGGRGAGAPAGAPPAGGQAQGGGGRAGGPPAPPAVTMLGPGVFQIGGNYTSLAIDMGDHILVVESGQSDARGMAVMAAAKTAIPNKPIRFVVNSHGHFDHASGLAAAAAEGATIITHSNNEPVLDRILSGPRTLVGDSLSKVPNARVNVDSVGDRDVRRGSNGKVVEIFHIPNEHTDGLLGVYLPTERVIWTGDVTATPQATLVQRDVVKAFLARTTQLNLQWDSMIPAHALNPERAIPRAEVEANVNPPAPASN